MPRIQRILDLLAEAERRGRAASPMGVVLRRVLVPGAALGAVLVGFSTGLVGCSVDAVGDPPDERLAEAPELAPLLVREAPFHRDVLLTGELRAVRRQTVHVPRLPDYQTTIRWIVDDGSRVREGDPVVELDTSQIASQLDEKLIARQQAVDELAAKEAEVAGTLAERKLAVERTRIALEKARIDAAIPEDLQPRRQYQERQLALERARVEHDKATADLEGFREASAAELQVLRIDLEVAKREVEEARRAIDTMVLRAPTSGVVVVSENRREGRKFQVGDNIWVGAEAASIPDLSAMEVRARLPDVDDGEVVAGMETVSTLDAYPERRYPGRIRSISPVARDAGRRSTRRLFEVVVELERSDPSVMRPGMSAQVLVRTVREERARLVPRAALVFGDDDVEVVLEDGGRRPVELGPCATLECVLEDGPPAGTPLGRAPAGAVADEAGSDR